ncbi:MAG: DUF2461 domain-containing protein [Candidatus Limnocylindrales bacterium]|jgi:uncharacterized protein (TIGR02453 family)|nr:DUF2461 domain-containing protein [Candidatus Limnocylindrales bacterium]
MAFEGFTREALQFLADLAANNERAWFAPRKADYERLLKHPLEALCVELGERFAEREIPLVADPARSPFRIYRDTRFSRDKSPYKPYVSASFPWRDGGPGGYSGGYFSLRPGEIYLGGGMYHPEASVLAAWRAVVAGRPAVVHAALDDPGFVGAFGHVGGERLKRTPAGFPADHPDAELLKLKDVTFSRQLADADALSDRLPDILADGFVAAMPVLRLLAGLVDGQAAPGA